MTLLRGGLVGLLTLRDKAVGLRPRADVEAGVFDVPDPEDAHLACMCPRCAQSLAKAFLWNAPDNMVEECSRLAEHGQG